MLVTAVRTEADAERQQEATKQKARHQVREGVDLWEIRWLVRYG